MSAYTSRPWVASGAADGGFRYHQIDAVLSESEARERARLGLTYPKTICDTSNRDALISAEEDVANAALLARAHEIPELEVQRDALADALLKAWRDGVFVEADLDLANEAEAALRAAGRLP